ncbi:MAG: alkyl hydroperoxide reductase [Alphaproteobacteria bacterium]|nr:carboxymuconolactone decarboxylase family protein [Alphaproteobacteria bacterium]TAD91463.1 MAG: alkyl hydroperoxide reductase [Alphaproteobacteria bacterium]
MNLDDIKARLPETAKDLRLNLGTVLTTPGLTPTQAWGAALAAAIAARNADLVAALDGAAPLDAANRAAARTAASLMAMNTIYYRFVHLMKPSVPDYATMPARLRMQGMASHGADTVDFELWSIAVAAVVGCGMCLEAHEHEVLKKGASREMVQAVVRIAAVVHAIAVTLDSVAVLEPGIAAAA